METSKKEPVIVSHRFYRILGQNKDPRNLVKGLKEQFVAKTYDDFPNELVIIQMLGPKADLGFMALSKSFEDLYELQLSIDSSGELSFSYGYISLTEVSEYAQTIPDDIKKQRLYPILPPKGLEYFCFYPMSKKRHPGANWYLLPFEKRKELMYSHGKVGAKFKGRILQLVTGSTGIDDYEWAVTLFSRTLQDIKECVYEMRFDEASAIYAEFGPFLIGKIIS